MTASENETANSLTAFSWSNSEVPFNEQTPGFLSGLANLTEV